MTSPLATATPEPRQPVAGAAHRRDLAARLQRLRHAWGGAAVWLLGLPGLALLASGLAVPLLDVSRARHEAETANLRQRLLAAATAGAGRATGVGDAASFVVRFPAPEARAPRLAALWADAQRRGLAVQRAEFRDVAPPALPGLVQQRVVLPVVGPPAAVWAWIGEALERDPALALLRLRIERVDTARSRASGGAAGVAATAVRAELEFGFYGRAVPAGAAR